MGHQSRLVLLLLLSLGILHVTFSSSPHPLDNVVHDDVKDNELESTEELTLQKNINNDIKISTPKVKESPSLPTKTSEMKKSNGKTVPTKPVSDEILNDLIEASKHSVALADDPRFNKMLPDKYKMENSTSSNKSEENYDEYYDYDEDYNYDETTSPEPTKSKSTTSKPISDDSSLQQEKQTIEMKPIKEDNKMTSKYKKVQNIDSEKQTNNVIDESDEDDYDEDEDDDDDDIADEEEVVFSENVPCPRYCVCARNINSYLVATCSRFDPGTQKFGSDITDLIVADVGPKYPILLGPEFFLQMGLKQVSSIKISNCTIEYLHPDAFHGLDELYSVNLTNVGLAIINPNTFSKNKKLRMLTISGNDLSVMSSVHYLLESSSIEELDLSRNNLMELNPNAFSKLTNIVYINLSQNNIQKIPEKVFDPVFTIEELDLSYNSIKTLPSDIFNHTTLAILQLKYNSIIGDLSFGTSDLQQLDLSFNAIKQVHHGMFDKMTGLTNLNLKGNNIVKIQPDSFMTLKNLRHIDLSINELDQISSMLFYKNSELDVIRLNDNPRLSQLPTDGFLTYNGYFTVYYLDISNCAIGALGHKTFSTMPHLATLKLAWNNINNLERDTFSSLTKLIELDLSNNLISKLDELTFMNNNDLTKLNLAGNPIRKLSVRLFLPMNKLRELDASDCELNTLLTDNQYGVGRKYKFYSTLRSFNASANQIRKITKQDVLNFKNLRTLDISHNPIKCNEDFQGFISYVVLSTTTVPYKIPTLANIDGEESNYGEGLENWADFAHDICIHHGGVNQETKDIKLEKSIEDVDKDLDEDAKKLLNIVETSKQVKLQKILKDSKKSEVVVDDNAGDSMEEDGNEEDLNNGGENKDDEEDDFNKDNDDEEDEDDEEDSEDDDENEDEDEDDYNSFDKKRTDSPNKIDNGIKIEKLDLGKEIINNKDKFIKDKILSDDDDSNDNSAEEEIIIERGHIYYSYSGYRFLIPIIIVVTCVIVILLAIAKIVALIMRKRGERYRLALLASSKNSFVYQKLTEEIKPTEKEMKQPKVHRYAPINQV